MADLIDHIEALSANIGPRPVSTEEEHQASCYVAQELTDAGLEVDMDEFATPSGVNWPFGIAFVLMIVGTVLSGFGLFFDGVSTAFLAVGLVLLVVGAIIYFAEHSDHPLLSNAFNRGVSQNVVAKYVPSSLARENRRRKVIIVAHVDTVRSELQANPTIVNFFPTYTKALYYTTIGLLVLLVIRLFPIPWPDMVDLVLWIISLVGCLVPLAGVVCIVAHKLLPYVEGANDNASGVAVMLDVAHRILDPRERERLSREMADEQAAEGTSEGDEETLAPQPVVHDAETAAAAGVVAEGAELEYATDAKDADADAPDATKVMPALDAEAAAATEAESEVDTSTTAEEAPSAEPADEEAASASVLEYPHSVSEAAIGSSGAASAAEAEQASDEAAEVVDADYEDAAVAEVNDAEREARFATLDEAQTAMQPRPHPKHEPEHKAEPEPEPEPDPSLVGMPAWYVAARQQAAREKPASDESDAEAVAASRSRYADIPLEGVSDLNASEEVLDAEEEVAEEEAPEQPLEEPPSGYADSEAEEAPAPDTEAETPEETPAAEGSRDAEATPAPAAETAQEAEPEASAAPATEQPSAEEAATSAAAEPVAASAVPDTSDTAEPAVAEAAAAPASAEPSAPAAPAAEAKPADESPAPAAPSAEQPSGTEASAPQPDEASAPAAEATPATTPAPASEKAPAASEAAPSDAAAEPEPAEEAATPEAAAEEPESPAQDTVSEAARELPTRIPAIGSSGSVSSEKRVSQLRSELESSIAGNARGSAPVARTHKDTKDAAPARRKPTARRVTEAFEPTKAVEDREAGFTGVTQAAAVSSTYEGTPQAGATPEQEFDPFAPSSVPEPAAAATPQPISPSASSQFPTVSPSASSQFPTVSPSASSQFPTVSPSASSQFPTVSPSASTQFPTVPASAAVNPSDFGAPAAPAPATPAPASAAPAPAPAPNQADYAAPANPVPTAMPQEPEPVEEYATLDPEIAVPQSRFRDALDGVAGAFGRIGRRNRRNQDREIDYGGWSNNEEASGGNDSDDEDIGWKGGAYYDGEADDEMPDAAFDDADESLPPADDSADELHPGRSGSFDSSAIDSARARAAEIRESIVTMTEHDLLDKEVWFVALGASSANNRGMRNFLDLHATELRGSLIINLEAVGAGDICYVDLEGRGKVERADRRLQTLVRKASKDLGEVMSAETLTWRDTDATPAMRAGLRAMTIMGFDGVAPTAWHWHTDTTLILDDNALDYTTKLILKMIENS